MNELRKIKIVVRYCILFYQKRDFNKRKIKGKRITRKQSKARLINYKA